MPVDTVDMLDFFNQNETVDMKVSRDDVRGAAVYWKDDKEKIKFKRTYYKAEIDYDAFDLRKKRGFYFWLVCGLLAIEMYRWAHGIVTSPFNRYSREAVLEYYQDSLEEVGENVLRFKK